MVYLSDEILVIDSIKLQIRLKAYRYSRGYFYCLFGVRTIVLGG